MVRHINNCVQARVSQVERRDNDRQCPSYFQTRSTLTINIQSSEIYLNVRVTPNNSILISSTLQQNTSRPSFLTGNQ